MALAIRSINPPATEPRRSPLPAAQAAVVLGLAYASVSVYWGLGGTWLLDTVGGSLERAGREGGVGISLLLWSAATLKAIVAVLPLLAMNHRLAAQWRRTLRSLAWVEGTVLFAYGLVLTGVGLLIQLGVVEPTADADHRALAWHAFLWDPWFLAWGFLVLAALRLSRRQRWF